MNGVYSRPPVASLKAVEDPSTCGLLTAADFARAVGCSTRAAQKWAASGRIEATKPDWCHSWLIPAYEVRRIVDEMKEAGRG